MNDRIKETLRNLPDSAGIYIMRDADGKVIYVGKAVSLKNRVRQYFHESTQRTQPKTRRLVMDIASIDYIMVRDEAEALMLECNLIKQHQPHYNIRLKDSKHYPYLRINMREDFPRMEVVRSRRRSDSARYFGPYMSATSLRRTIDTVSSVFPLRSCTKDIARAVKNGERPCLNAQIGRCLAPCTGKVTREEYHAVAREVVSFLSGGHEDLSRRLRVEMESAADALDFEKAAQLRDKLTAVLAIGGDSQAAISNVIVDADILGIHTEGEVSSINLMMMRSGKLIGSDGFILEGEGDSEETSDSFIKQFYLQSTVLPREIILRTLPLEAQSIEHALRDSCGHKVQLLCPQRGEKRRLLEISEKNALERMLRDKAEKERAWERTGGAVNALGEILSIAPPSRIECYDISNIQGTDSVASMVVFKDGKAQKSQYRRFRIKTVEGANDFASMKEVLTRRFTDGLAERRAFDAAGEGYENGAFSLFPDLVVIDGGEVQLRFAMEAMAGLGMGDIPSVGLAKRFEHIILPDAQEVVLPRTSAALHLLERIRDEAHRFAITYHRSLRSARTLRSELENIKGIGEKRRKALLRAYPMRALMDAATADELRAVDGMNESAANAVYAYLHPQDNNAGVE